MKNIANKKGVLVLGMHRSGTSAVTAALEVLGASLGPKNDYVNEENPKGFFENKDVIQLNDRILEQIGSSWNNPFTVRLDERIHELDAFYGEAVAILENSYKDIPLWCLKDPRISLLLPFWQKVIARSLGCQILYVHVLRNPLEVADSLKVRGKKFRQFLCGDTKQSFLLWFSYYFQALSSVDSDQNILVTFDDLIENPLEQLNRLASFLEIEPDKGRLQKYVDSFLETQLKHHVDSISTFRYQYPDFTFIADLYEDLVALKDLSSFSRDDVRKIFTGLPDLRLFQTCCNVAKGVFRDAFNMHVLQQKNKGSSRTTAEHSQKVLELEQKVSERDRQLTSLTKAISERDSQLASLAKVVSELSELSQMVSNRDNQVNHLRQRLEERQDQVVALSRVITARNEQQVKLKNTIAEIENIVSQKDHLYLELQERYLQVACSLPWRIVSKASPPLARIPGLPYLFDRAKTVLASRRDQKARDLIEQSGLFDSEYYIEANPDIEEEGMDPLSHFIKYGASERRRPSPTFDLEFYLGSYPDVGMSGLNPLLHYILFGREREYLFHDDSDPIAEAVQEQPGTIDQVTSLVSIALLPDIDILGSFDSMDPARETVMVVSHEGSRTGAPILSYNLVKKLLEKYNVVALFLGPGPMAKACFSEGAVAIFSSKEYCWQPEMAEKLLNAVIGTVKLKYVLVNSIESRGALTPLARAFVPTVTLIHEFAVYTRPVDAFWETVLWSGRTVFSSDVTYSNMIQEHPFLVEQRHEVLPQGRCEVPVEHLENDDEAGTGFVPEPDKVILRPTDFPPDGIVVLGAGFVQIRKGVDLFIACAAKVTASFPEIPFRFVWVGKGYDPVHKMDYSVYLADQVARAGLESYVFFMDEVADIEAVYAQADIMLLSSRLDPLPNVAIDAFYNDLPVVCFSKTTGIAEVLDNFGLSDFCVAGYLDIDDMANKVGRLAQSGDLRRDVADKARIQALEIFNMDHYVEQLDQLAQQIECRTRQEREDVKTIAASNLLDCDFFVPSFLEDNEVEVILRYYVRSWASGVLRRKLFPGFHPGIYFEQHGTIVADGDPLADYIREGKPPGPWNFDLILPGKQPDLARMKLRVGLHIHAYYPELLPDLLARLAQNCLAVELLISVVSESDRCVVLEYLEKYEFQYKVLTVPNRGRDIGPLLTGFGDAILAEYDIIGHMHTKKSLECEESMGKKWYLFLLENLIGGKAPMADIIIRKMFDNSDIAMVFPCDPNVVSWDRNYSFAEKLLPGWGVETIPQEFELPVGTMFWARSTVLRKLFDLNLQWDDYPDEPVPYDGTLLHAIERSLGFLAVASGKSIALSHVPGITR